MQVLHLVDPEVSPPAAALLTPIALERGGHAVWALGPCSLESLPLYVSRRLPNLRPTHPASWLSLGRALGRERELGLIHTLSLRTAGAARLLRPDVPCLVTLPSPTDFDRLALSERWAVRRPGLWFAVGDVVSRDTLRRRGVAAERIAVIEPGVDPSMLRPDTRRALRMRWGITDDETLVVAALSDPPDRADALEALMSVGLAWETGRRLVALLSPRAAGLDRARRVLQDVGRHRSMMVSALLDRPWEILPACDAALALTAGPSATWAMLAGLPIVAPDTPHLRGQFTDGRSALLAPPGKVGRLAGRLCRLTDDPGLARRLGQTAREEAIRRYHPARFAQQWSDLCQCVAAGGGPRTALPLSGAGGNAG